MVDVQDFMKNTNYFRGIYRVLAIQSGGSKGLSYPALDDRPHPREGPTPTGLVGPWMVGPAWLGYEPVTCSHLMILLYSFEVCSIDSSKVIGNSPEVSNFNQSFLKLNRFICN